MARSTLPLGDELLDKEGAARLLKMSKDRYVKYALRFKTLCDGARIVRIEPKSRGRKRWLRSAVIAHMHLDLLVGEDAA